MVKKILIYMLTCTHILGVSVWAEDEYFSPADEEARYSERAELTEGSEDCILTETPDIFRKYRENVEEAVEGLRANVVEACDDPSAPPTGGWLQGRHTPWRLIDYVTNNIDSTTQRLVAEYRAAWNFFQDIQYNDVVDGHINHLRETNRFIIEAEIEIGKLCGPNNVILEPFEVNGVQFHKGMNIMVALRSVVEQHAVVRNAFYDTLETTQNEYEGYGSTLMPPAWTTEFESIYSNASLNHCEQKRFTFAELRKKIEEILDGSLLKFDESLERWRRAYRLIYAGGKRGIDYMRNIGVNSEEGVNSEQVTADLNGTSDEEDKPNKEEGSSAAQGWEQEHKYFFGLLDEFTQEDTFDMEEALAEVEGVLSRYRRGHIMGGNRFFLDMDTLRRFAFNPSITPIQNSFKQIGMQVVNGILGGAGFKDAQRFYNQIQEARKRAEEAEEVFNFSNPDGFGELQDEFFLYQDVKDMLGERYARLYHHLAYMESGGVEGQQDLFGLIEDMDTMGTRTNEFMQVSCRIFHRQGKNLHPNHCTQLIKYPLGARFGEFITETIRGVFGGGGE